MAPFQPVGDRARWRTVYDLLRKADTGALITYERIGKALGLDPDDDRHVIQMAVRRAAREHEVADKRAIDVIPNSGYMVVPAPENLRLARSQQKKAGKSLARGQSKVVHVDLSGLDPETRAAFEVVARAFSFQMEVVQRLDVRQARLEDTVNAMSQRTVRTEQEIADLKARLARLEEGETLPGG
jgi:hypothetical protein